MNIHDYIVWNQLGFVMNIHDLAGTGCSLVHSESESL
jgi:hypothetical protein